MNIAALTKDTKATRRTTSVLEMVETFRLEAAYRTHADKKSDLGQFLTPASIARLMAGMFDFAQENIFLLDPGAGVGSLSAACVEEICRKENPPRYVKVTAYEIDKELLGYLEQTYELCSSLCKERGIKFEYEIHNADFIERGIQTMHGGMFSSSTFSFNCAILNPPYKKISSQSSTRQLLSEVGIETGNLYTAFLAVAMRLLDADGQMVAITPRSFCNGPYFRPFRELFLRDMALSRLHVFETRKDAFQDDAVLQENIVFSATKSRTPLPSVVVTSSTHADEEYLSSREVPYTNVVSPNDPEMFIHIVQDELGGWISESMSRFTCPLNELGVTVSTGRVVDFRAKEYLRPQPAQDTVPLIFPTHFSEGTIKWPKKNSKKPNALVRNVATEGLLIPNEMYVVVKRFSAKEEKKRVVASIYDPNTIDCEMVGFENHLNYFHQNARGLDTALAKGLFVFLNSTLVDTYFRQFNGHTQVNATDLRNLKYPSLIQLRELGEKASYASSQEAIDALLEQELLSEQTSGTMNPIRIMKRTQEALAILKELGLPREQQNERSALTLLALLDLKSETPWSEAGNPLCGITPMMEFFATHYGKQYKPNTRETVRRQTVHQFLEAGLIVANPDQPDRPVNSPKAVYQIESSALELLRTYGTGEWDKNLGTYLSSIETLKKRYAREREMTRLPVQLAEGKTITLSPGGQNVLVKQIVEDFASLYTPGGQLIYIGDTDEKFAYFDEEALSELGVTIEAHGKMPDVILHHTEKNWLILIEAVTSHGPVDGKRRDELKRLFAKSKAGLVFVTAFLTRKAMVEYLGDISWETEVWIAEAPSHLIHFNGDRFLGPYPD